MRASAAAFVFIAFFAVACETKTCPVKAIRHVVAEVVRDATNGYEFDACVQSDQCAALCRRKALEMAPYDAGVTDCHRVESDAGIDGGASGGAEQITLDITYREYAFCGA